MANHDSTDLFGNTPESHKPQPIVYWPLVFHGKDLRTAIDERDKSMLFHAGDLGEVLGYANIHDAIAKNRIKTTRLRFSDTIGRSQETIFISEQGMYKLAFRSNKPEAEEFTDKVAQILADLRAGRLTLRPTSQSIRAHMETRQQKENSKTINRLAYTEGGREEIVRLNANLCKKLSDNGWPPKDYKDWAKASGYPAKHRGSGQEVLRYAEPHSACACSLAKNLISMGVPETEAYEMAGGTKDFFKRLLPYATPAELISEEGSDQMSFA